MNIVENSKEDETPRLFTTEPCAAGLDCPLTDHHTIHLLDGLPRWPGFHCSHENCTVSFQKLTPRSRWCAFARFAFRSLHRAIGPRVGTLALGFAVPAVPDFEAQGLEVILSPVGGGGGLTDCISLLARAKRLHEPAWKPPLFRNGRSRNLGMGNERIQPLRNGIQCLAWYTMHYLCCCPPLREGPYEFPVGSVATWPVTQSKAEYGKCCQPPAILPSESKVKFTPPCMTGCFRTG